MAVVSASSALGTQLLRRLSSVTGPSIHACQAHWQTSVLALRLSLPMRSEPKKKKKKVDPKRDQMVKDRMRKKIKKLERVPPELIPIEDWVVPTKYLDDTRVRILPEVSEVESERRALLMKEWSRYKLGLHKAEMEAIGSALEAQRVALEELRLESEELYQAAVKRDQKLFPFESEGPCYTPPKSGYQAPEGKYNDITKVYTQVNK
ncbi:39S ribosomal protein L40, mitochondrial [Polypterus senegalus]|uniref:39S ribosomal protein L40, mitochondrial n=1 Tax=Polypterus senegalus TaxID=55291 RepID=UPI0019647488|nr:39S ribosomal protein L40, mitochondrial [Polypterus senegalus]